MVPRYIRPAISNYHNGMAQKLWQKKNYSLNHLVEEFETGSDLLLDQHLVPYDVYGTMAHAYMLCSIDILTKKELEQIYTVCLDILEKNEIGKFTMEMGDEDVHTKIENAITKKYKQAGLKVHTGRSRNDQVLTALRMYSKDNLLNIWKKTITLLRAFIEFAEKYEMVPMPGYTHMQKAMPSSVGMWAGAYAESIADFIPFLKETYALVNQSPLGAGAGYGVPLPINREETASILGFEKVQNNSLYTQNSRGKIESTVIFTLLQIVSDISRFAQDIMLFTTSEYNFFTVDAALTTGSSIMPQKRNVDIAELLRSKVHIYEGYLHQIFSITATLPSGYNRDVQDAKKPYIEAIEQMPLILDVATLMVKSLKPNKEVLQKSLTPDLFAAGAAYQMVQKGIPFREAYRDVGENLDKLKSMDGEYALKLSKHSGGTANLHLQRLRQHQIRNANEVKEEIGKFRIAIANLLSKCS